MRNATVHAGLGVTALASTGERLVVGGRAIMLEEKIGVAVADARVTELEAQGRSVLLVALGDRLVGLIALQDGLRSGARAAVQQLLDARIEPVLLSGEARETCETIGRALDIEHVRPEVLPADRGPEVRALAEGGSVVAVIGHPVSDDGALGAADVAIAMGAAGSTPGEWAVALASDDVRDAAMALAIPHATRARVRVAIVARRDARASWRSWRSASASPRSRSLRSPRCSARSPSPCTRASRSPIGTCRRVSESHRPGALAVVSPDPASAATRAVKPAVLGSPAATSWSLVPSASGDGRRADRPRSRRARPARGRAPW